jgi:two-component system, cell cycle sensor histidine kinase and response regulator CckA
VLEAELPEAAIEIAARHDGRIHLLLSDMVMPGMDGRALAGTLSPIRPEMKVVYMSGYTGFTPCGLADSEVTWVAKPFTRQTLLRKVREAITSEPKVESK